MDSPDTLLLGFSFSMHPDGSPSSYNKAIADAMWGQIAEHRSNGVKVLLAAQWEIVDALTNKHDERLFDDKTLTFVAKPPKFKANDVLDAASLVRLLRDPKTEAARQLCKSLRQVGYKVDAENVDSNANLLDRASMTADQLANHLNGLLSDTTMYLEFMSKVELHNLHRKKKGALGFEARKMPEPRGELLQFQTIRVNRLIIEAVIPDKRVLQRSTYLNTQQVLDSVLDHFEDDKVQRIKHVRVFGFRTHSPRCRKLTIESFCKKGNNLEPENVKDIPVDSEWDPTTAQMWCRSRRNHEDYDNMPRQRKSP